MNRMGRNIFWYQTEEMFKEVVTLNGRVLSGDEETEVFGELTDVSFDVREHTPWCGRVKGKYFVKGVLDAKDVKGRWMSFLFLSDEEDGKSALLQELKNRGYNMTAETLACVDALEQKKNDSTPKKGKVVIAVICAVIVAAILFVYHLIQK